VLAAGGLQAALWCLLAVSRADSRWDARTRYEPPAQKHAKKQNGGMKTKPARMKPVQSHVMRGAKSPSAEPDQARNHALTGA
jgi:hypothetical protein